MKVFILGATGWIGSAITDAFLVSQHQVVGLTRTAEGKSELEAKGVTAVQGDMSEYEVLLTVAHQTDAVIVASSASRSVTLVILKALVAALRGTQKPLVYVSGSSLYGDIGNQEKVDEQVFVQRLIEPPLQQSPEQIVYQAREQGIHSMIVIGAGILYGRGGGATPTFLLNDAYQRNAAWVIGKGTQRWSAVHVDDLARLIVQTVEQKPASGVVNAVAEALSLRNVAEMIVRATHVTDGIQEISEQAAHQEWGSFWAESLSQNLWLSSMQAERVLGWKPSSPSFNDDLLYGSYQARKR